MPALISFIAGSRGTIGDMKKHYLLNFCAFGQRSRFLFLYQKHSNKLKSPSFMRLMTYTPTHPVFSGLDVSDIYEQIYANSLFNMNDEN